MSNSREEILADLRAHLTAEQPYLALAARAQASGQAILAHYLRAIDASETIRRQLMLNGFTHHQDEVLNLYVCPHCGLLWITDTAPEKCPVDDTPGAAWLRVE
jgi:rubrerythrin